MVANKVIKIKKNKFWETMEENQGQALFEFLAFLPFMLIFYSVTLTIGNAINGSINQQKITRGYYFNITHNDSYLPTVEVLSDIRSRESLRQVGMFALGWRWMKEGNNQSVAPCYKIMSLSGETSDELCSPGNLDTNTTQFIRVKTVFGICTGTYFLNNNFYLLGTNIPGLQPVASYSSCLNLR